MSGVRELIQNLPSNLNVFRNTSFTYLFKWGIGKFFLKKKETGGGKNISDFGKRNHRTVVLKPYVKRKIEHCEIHFPPPFLQR